MKAISALRFWFATLVTSVLGIRVFGCIVDSAGSLSRCAPACKESLQNRGIETIFQDAWLECSHLVNLWLSHNAIHAFPSESLRLLVNLRSLSLSHNNLTVLTEADLEAVDKVSVLDLSFNNLREVSPHLLDSAVLLRRLDLSHNNLSFIPRNVAAMMNQLDDINMAGNPGSMHCPTAPNTRCKFAQIQHKSPQRVHFCVCGGLSTRTSAGVDETSGRIVADLSRQNIRTIRNNAFTSGEFVWISERLPRRQLAALAKDAYSATPAITRLDLTLNGLTAIDALAFNGLNALEELILYDNKLSSLPAGVFSTLPAIKRIDVMWNPGRRNCPYNTDNNCRFGVFGGDRTEVPFCYCFAGVNISAPQYQASAAVLQAALPAASRVTDLAGRPDTVRPAAASKCQHLNGCSGHGHCNNVTNTCACFSGWGAPEDVMTLKAADCSNAFAPNLGTSRN